MVDRFDMVNARFTLGPKFRYVHPLYTGPAANSGQVERPLKASSGKFRENGLEALRGPAANGPKIAPCRAHALLSDQMETQ